MHSSYSFLSFLLFLFVVHFHSINSDIFNGKKKEEGNRLKTEEEKEKKKNRKKKKIKKSEGRGEREKGREREAEQLTSRNSSRDIQCIF